MIPADQLPAGWSLRPLGRLIEPLGEKVEPGEAPDAPYIGLEHIEAHTRRILGHGRGADVRSTKAVFRAGDVLYGKLRPYLNKVAIPDFDGIASTDILVFRGNAEIDAGYLARLLSSTAFVEIAHLSSGGMELPRTSWKTLKSVEVPVPPLPVQRRLVAQLEVLDAGRADAAGHLRQARAVLDRFHLGVLRAAYSGKLTEDWRSKNVGTPVEPLLTELRQNLEVKRGRRDFVSPPPEDDLLALPEGWAWARVGEIGTVQIGGTPSRKETAYWGGDVQWVSSGEVANCRIASTRETITDLGLAESSAKVYPAGTVLIAMIGEGKTRGQSALLEVDAATNQNVAGISPNRHVVEPEYLWQWALSEYDTTRAAGRGGNQSALNGQKVRELTLPIPPIEEQREIVSRAQRLLETGATVVGQSARALDYLEKSGQALLGEALRGQLLGAEALAEGVDVSAEAGGGAPEQDAA